MKKRSGFAVMARLIGLVKPLSGYMSLAVLMGLVGHLCAASDNGFYFRSCLRPSPGIFAVCGAGVQPLYRI